MKKTILLALIAVVSCGSPGSVRFTTWGEEYIEQQIPAEVFEDGWVIRYSKFLVTIGEIKVADHTGKVGATQQSPRLFDMHKPGPVAIESFSSLDPIEWDTVSYAIAPSADTVLGNAEASDLELMKQHGYSIYVEATATKGSTTKSIKWGFATNTLYEHCQQADFGKGITVPSGAGVDVELTIHGDHLYYDDLQSADAKDRFDAIAAADANGDGEVTMDELAAVDLTTLPIGQYGTGGASSIHNLKDFVSALARTIGHYRGEGECEPRAR